MVDSFLEALLSLGLGVGNDELFSVDDPEVVDLPDLPTELPSIPDIHPNDEEPPPRLEDDDEVIDVEEEQQNEGIV